MNRLFVTGDTHGVEVLRRLGTKKFSVGKSLDKDDFVVILGDFGVIWNPLGPSKEEKHILKWLNSKSFTTLVVAGNHENFDRLDKLEKTNATFINGPVRIISDKVFLLNRGEIYNIGGRKVLVIDGAASYDKQYRTEFLSWWKQEEWTCKEQSYCLTNLEKHQYSVDYIFAHTLPFTIAASLGFADRFYPMKTCNVSKFLDYLVQVVKFKDFYCGHWHTNMNRGQYHILYDRIMEVK